MEICGVKILGGAAPMVDRSDRRFDTFEEAKHRYPDITDHIAPLFLQKRFEQRTPEWFAARRHAITASDFATAINHNPYCIPWQLYLKKTGREIGFKGNDYTRWGNYWEDAAACEYERREGRVILDFGLMSHTDIYRKCPPGVDVQEWYKYVHGEDSVLDDDTYGDQRDGLLTWMKGSPDGVTTDGILVEIKCPGLGKTTVRSRKSVPKHYRPQLQLLMELLDLEEAHFIQFVPKTQYVPNGDYVKIVERRDRVWFAENKMIASALWDNVLHTRKTREVPPALLHHLDPPVNMKRARDKDNDDDDDGTVKRPKEMDDMQLCISDYGFADDKNAMAVEQDTVRGTASNINMLTAAPPPGVSFDISYDLYRKICHKSNTVPLSKEQYTSQ